MDTPVETPALNQPSSSAFSAWDEASNTYIHITCACKPRLLSSAGLQNAHAPPSTPWERARRSAVSVHGIWCGAQRGARGKEGRQW